MVWEAGGVWQCDPQPLNKPIKVHFIRKAISEDQKRRREPGKQSDRAAGLTCASSVTDPCAASFAAGRDSRCRWGQRAEVRSMGSSLYQAEHPGTCRNTSWIRTIVQRVFPEEGSSNNDKHCQKQKNKKKNFCWHKNKSYFKGLTEENNS